MLKTIIDNLSTRIHELENEKTRMDMLINHTTARVMELEYKNEELQLRLDKLHVVSDKPIGILKPSSPKISHRIGKLTKSNT